MSQFSFNIEGIVVRVEVSNHAAMRMSERNVDKYATYGSVVALGGRLLDMKNKEEFCIMDKEVGIAVCCALHMDGLDLTVDIITVLDNYMFFVKDGVRVYQLMGEEE